MKYIDLTHTFKSSMPVYPGDPIPEMVQVADIDKEGYTDFQIKTGMHVGTHLDAPLHMIKDGVRIPNLPLEKFFGKGHLIDAVNKDINADLLFDRIISKGDILIINTGYYKKYSQPEYYETYPEVLEDFAKKAIELGVSIIGMDTPSPDRLPFSIHKLLLSNGVLIIENLTNLDVLNGIESFSVYALPAKLDTEAAPVRVIASI